MKHDSIKSRSCDLRRSRKYVQNSELLETLLIEIMNAHCIENEAHHDGHHYRAHESEKYTLTFLFNLYSTHHLSGSIVHMILTFHFPLVLIWRWLDGATDETLRGRSPTYTGHL